MVTGVNGANSRGLELESNKGLADKPLVVVASDHPGGKLQEQAEPA